MRKLLFWIIILLFFYLWIVKHTSTQSKTEKCVYFHHFLTVCFENLNAHLNKQKTNVFEKEKTSAISITHEIKLNEKKRTFKYRFRNVCAGNFPSFHFICSAHVIVNRKKIILNKCAFTSFVFLNFTAFPKSHANLLSLWLKTFIYDKVKWCFGLWSTF